jgi:hypothetical protein
MYAPSAQIESLLTAVASRPATSAGMRAMMQRTTDFPNLLQAQLTGIALDPYGRDVADQFLDTYWSDQPRQQFALRSAGTDREAIIGSGIHAAVYAAVRVLSGYPRPLVLERHERAGGTFAMTDRPTFHLNSRNRPGTGGPARSPTPPTRSVSNQSPVVVGRRHWLSRVRTTYRPGQWIVFRYD